MMALASTNPRVRATCKCRFEPRAAPLWVQKDAARWLQERGIVLPSTMAIVLWRCPRCGNGAVLTVRDLQLAVPIA